MNCLGQIVLAEGDRVAELGIDASDAPAKPGYAPFSVKGVGADSPLKLQAASPLTRDRWLKALKDAFSPMEVEEKGALSDDDDSDGEDRASCPTPLAEDAVAAAVFQGEKATGVRDAPPLSSGSGVQVTLHLSGARVDRGDEAGLFVAAVDHEGKEVARTETVKAGDAGAFAIEDRAKDVIRQFACLLPVEAAVSGRLRVYRKRGRRVDLSVHDLLFHASCEAARGAAPCGGVLEIPLEKATAPLRRGTDAESAADEPPPPPPESTDECQTRRSSGIRPSVMRNPTFVSTLRGRATTDLDDPTTGRLLLVGVAKAFDDADDGARPYQDAERAGSFLL